MLTDGGRGRGGWWGVDEHRGEREEEARAGAGGLRKKIFPSIPWKREVGMSTEEKERRSLGGGGLSAQWVAKIWQLLWLSWALGTFFSFIFYLFTPAAPFIFFFSLLSSFLRLGLLIELAHIRVESALLSLIIFFLIIIFFSDLRFGFFRPSMPDWKRRVMCW